MGGIKGLTFKFGGHKHALQNTKGEFYKYYYTGKTTNPQYPETFKKKVSVIEYYGEAIGTDPGMAK